MAAAFFILKERFYETLGRKIPKRDRHEGQ